MPLAKPHNGLSLGVALDPVVVAEVTIFAVEVVFSVRLVVFFFVAHEVGERESVVRGDKVDTVIRLSSARLVKVARTGQSRGQGSEAALELGPISVTGNAYDDIGRKALSCIRREVVYKYVVNGLGKAVCGFCFLTIISNCDGACNGCLGSILA